ncbi:MAG: lamin tail domain-containing protein [Proteobacteria bacterium]|nr:lamin tail domain-containing protein [Pseudomonadota bacterium]
MSYIELFNNTKEAIDLDGYSIETSTGEYDLDGLPGPLGPGGYFVLMSGHSSEVGISNELDVPGIVIGNATCGHVTDTVLLRDSLGDVVDAMSYGVSKDLSSRYVEAVSAGQFTAGEFVSVASEFGELVLGRDRGNTDTNNVADWYRGGGIHALVGSPFGSNTALPTGADHWILFFQSFVAGTVSQDYFGVQVLDANYTGFSGTARDSVATQTLVVEGEILGPGTWSLSGVIANHLDVIDGDIYSVRSSGTLLGSNGRYLTFFVERELGGASENLTIDAVFSDGVETYPYSMEVTQVFSGARGAFTQSIERGHLGWGGIKKVTTGRQTVAWTLSDSSGLVSSVAASAVYSRPFPLSDGWVGNVGGTPEPVLATETTFLDRITVPTSTGYTSNWSRYELQFDNGQPGIKGVGFTNTLDSTPGVFVESTVSGDMTGGGISAPFTSYSRTEVVSGTKLFRYTGGGSIAGRTLYGLDSVFDPKPIASFGWWSKFKKGVKITAQTMGSVSMYAIGGLGCAGTTLGTAALGGTVTVSTLGVATPATLAAGGAAYVVCLGLVKGADAVVDEIWKR